MAAPIQQDGLQRFGGLHASFLQVAILTGPEITDNEFPRFVVLPPRWEVLCLFFHQFVSRLSLSPHLAVNSFLEKFCAISQSVTAAQLVQVAQSSLSKRRARHYGKR